MKNLYILLVLLSTYFAWGQNQRFVYEYTFKPDSLDHSFKIEELMNLDVDKNGSLFYSSLHLKSDSILKNQIEKGIRSGGSFELDMRKTPKAQAKFIISKKYPDFEITFSYPVGASNLAIKSQNIMHWKILPDTDKIQGFDVQKAVTDFGGRHWTAWFTNQIQIQDGPYKFCGLPGLILSVEDDEGEHIIKLVGSKKLDTMQYPVTMTTQKTLVSSQRFNQLWNEFKNDPAKTIKIMHSSSEMSETVMFNANTGKPMTKQELIRGKEERDRAYFKRFNNYIEPQLFR